MSKQRYTETGIALPRGFTLRVVHLHNGNSSNNKRNGHPMVTIAQVRSIETGEVICEAKARCSKREHGPSRKIGRHVAVGRVLKEFYEDQFQLAEGI